MTKCSHCGHAAETPFTFCPRCGTQSVAAGDDGPVGRILNGKYRVLARIGAGSMGTVYLGEHVSLRKRIALKVLHRELQVGEEALKRFQREGIAAGQFSHPNAIQIFDFDRTEDGLSYLAMEHVDGVDLKAWLQREGPLPPARALPLFRQLLSTLAEAHRQGIVHRDLKPENLMVVSGTEAAPTLKVLDFGLSKLVDRTVDQSLLTMSGRVLGTPLYMSPEQWNGEPIDQRADLYAAALILYEMLSGRQPFKGSNLTETLVKSTTEAPTSLLALEGLAPMPAGLDEVVQRALAKKREERFQTAGELLAALDALDLDVVERASRRARARRAARRPTAQRSRLLIGLGAAGLAAIAVAVPLLGGGLAAAPVPLLRLKEARDRSDEERGYLALVDDARDYLAEGQLAAALDTANKASAHRAADAEALLVRGLVFRRQGDREAATQDFADALLRHPAYAAAAAGIGWVHLDHGELDRAEQRFRAAMELDADCPEGATGLGAVHSARGRHQEAVKVLEAAAGRFPDAALLHYHLGLARRALGDQSGAIAALTQARRKDPALWQAHVEIAEIHLAKGNAQGGESQLRDALQLRGAAQVPLRRRLAELLAAQGRFGDVRDMLAPVLQGCRDGEVWVLQGLALADRQDPAGAAEAWQRALELGTTQTARVHLLLALQHAAEGRWERVADHCRLALEQPRGLTGAEEARADVDWALALFHLGDHARAAERLERAVAVDEANPVAHHTLGLLYMDYLGRPAEAVAQFERYRELGGDDPRVEQWLQRLQR